LSSWLWAYLAANSCSASCSCRAGFAAPACRTSPAAVAAARWRPAKDLPSLWRACAQSFEGIEQASCFLLVAYTVCRRAERAPAAVAAHRRAMATARTSLARRSGRSPTFRLAPVAPRVFLGEPFQMIGPGLPGVGSASTTATVSRTRAHREDARPSKAEVERSKATAQSGRAAPSSGGDCCPRPHQSLRQGTVAFRRQRNAGLHPA
jgi:hypothetical protein